MPTTSTRRHCRVAATPDMDHFLLDTPREPRANPFLAALGVEASSELRYFASVRLETAIERVRWNGASGHLCELAGYDIRATVRKHKRAAPARARSSRARRSKTAPPSLRSANGQCIKEPPSTTSVWPVMKSLSPEAKKISEPMRSSGSSSRLSARLAVVASIPARV